MLRLLRACEKGLQQLQDAVQAEKPHRQGPSATQVAHCHGLVRAVQHLLMAPLKGCTPELREPWMRSSARRASQRLLTSVSCRLPLFR
jgi:hypothetical protein